MVFDVLQKLGEGDPIHGVEDDASESAPLSGTTRGHDEFSFRFNLKPRLVMQPTDHVANVCRNFELEPKWLRIFFLPRPTLSVRSENSNGCGNREETVFGTVPGVFLRIPTPNRLLGHRDGARSFHADTPQTAERPSGQTGRTSSMLRSALLALGLLLGHLPRLLLFFEQEASARRFAASSNGAIPSSMSRAEQHRTRGFPPRDR